ncbi:MAG: hypothetical protein QW275_00300 [Candidatus Anstonellaceae archaeon]
MIVEDKRNKLFFETDPILSKKFSEAGFGLPGKEGLLHPLEAAYIVKIGLSSFKQMSLQEFISNYSKTKKSFKFAFAVYSLIRGKGRIVRPYDNSFKYFRVYAPGVGREEDRPSQLVCIFPGKLTRKSIEEELQKAHLARLDLIAACGREEEIKFYKISSFNF